MSTPSPLHLAAFEGNADAARRLLEQGADPNATDRAGMSVLHMALYSGHNALARLLLANGATPPAPWPHPSPLLFKHEELAQPHPSAEEDARQQLAAGQLAAALEGYYAAPVTLGRFERGKHSSNLEFRLGESSSLAHSITLRLPHAEQPPVSLARLLGREEDFDPARGSNELPLALGRDLYGKPLIAELARLPHLLLAEEAPGEECAHALRALILSLVFRHSPQELQLLSLGPPAELPRFATLPHLAAPPVAAQQQLACLQGLVAEAKDRLYSIARTHVQPRALVVIIHELASLGRPEERSACEEALRFLARAGKRARIHIIAATREPAALPGELAERCFPARLCFRLNAADSIKLLGHHAARNRRSLHFLYRSAPNATIIPAQAPRVNNEDFAAVMEHWALSACARSRED